MQCPRCGSTRVDHQGPGPGEGGLFFLLVTGLVALLAFWWLRS